MSDTNIESRRRFMSTFGAGGAGLTIAPLLAMQAAQVSAASPKGEPAFGAGFGPLTPKLPLNTDELNNPLIGDLRNKEILSLPDGFEYWAVSFTGDTLSDGNLVPSNHDGMAAFRSPTGGTILVRNHELGTTGSSGLRCITPSGATYDPTQAGGTTTLVLDNHGKLVSHVGSLAGTTRNCAGGLTPWNTWLSCEETFNTISAGSASIRHGYVFEVPADGEGSIKPIREMGRRNHEAAAVDPSTGYVYLTEDRGDSLLYRFRPNVYGDLRSGGVLEALRIIDMPGVNTARDFQQFLFKPLATDWVSIEVADPDSESAGASNRAQGQAKGAARFTRGEGCWWGNGKVYFVCSNGGNAGRGQIFAYDPAEGTVTLFVESVADTGGRYADNGGFLLAAPDNITVGPDGRLYVCEDGSGVEKVVGVGLDGELYEVAINLLNGSEFAGACFSHDGRFMFVSLQSPGLTLVIRGNWRKGRRF